MSQPTQAQILAAVEKFRERQPSNKYDFFQNEIVDAILVEIGRVYEDQEIKESLAAYAAKEVI